MKKSLYCLLCIVFIIGILYDSHAQIISNFAGNGLAGYSGDGGDATLAKVDTPTSLAIDLFGNVYINDQRNHCIRKVEPSGIITTVAGNGTYGFAGDGGPATNANFKSNWGMAVDAAGNIFIADQYNNRIRKVTTDGIINTIAGTGSLGFAGDGGPAISAKLASPISVAVDNTGNVFIGDKDNFCIRKINVVGTITTYAGIPSSFGYSGDGGPATNARLGKIFGMVTDDAGNLYMCDGDHNVVRKVSTSGIITTIAGTGTYGFSGDGAQATAATLRKPLGIFRTKEGAIFISDTYNNRVRKISPSGIITTIAGTGDAGYNGEGIPATTAKLFDPIGVVADTAGNVYIADVMNARVRKVVNVLSFIRGDHADLSVCQNSPPVSINELLAVKDVYVGLTATWSLTLAPLHGTATAAYATTSPGGVVTPTGLTYTPAAGYIGADSFKVRVSNALSEDEIIIYVSVDPLIAPAPILGPASVCVGDTITLTNTNVGGVWGRIFGNISVFGTGPACKVVGALPGIDTVFYTVLNACGILRSARAVTVNALPDPGTLTGPAAICMGSTGVFIPSVAGGSWSGSNQSIILVGSTGTAKGLAPGSATIVYTVQNAFCKAAAIQTIRIETFPDAGDITGPANICLGEQITLIDTIPGGVWTSELGNTTVSFGLVTGIALGKDYINYSLTNSCGTDVATRQVNVLEVPLQPFISVDQGNLAAPKGYAHYQWKVDGEFIPGATSDTLFADHTGIYQVVVTNQVGCKAESNPLEYFGCSPDDMEIYPSPARNTISVIWCKKVTVRIVTVDGKLVATGENVTKIDIINMPAGMYFLTVFDSNGIRVKTHKIVKLW